MIGMGAIIASQIGPLAPEAINAEMLPRSAERRNGWGPISQGPSGIEAHA